MYSAHVETLTFWVGYSWGVITFYPGIKGDYQIRVRELYSTEAIISRLKKMHFLLDVSSASYWTDLNDYHTAD